MAKNLFESGPNGMRPRNKKEQEPKPTEGSKGGESKPSEERFEEPGRRIKEAIDAGWQKSSLEMNPQDLLHTGIESVKNTINRAATEGYGAVSQELREIFLQAAIDIQQKLLKGGYDSVTIEYLNQVGGARNLMGAETIIHLGDLLETEDDLNNLHQDYNIAFFHVPGGMWEIAREKIQERNPTPIQSQEPQILPDAPQTPQKRDGLLRWLRRKDK